MVRVGSTGVPVRRFTVARLERALRGLRDHDDIEAL